MRGLGVKKVVGALLLVLCLLSVGQPVLADDPMVGEIRIWAGSTAPDGWQFCQGQKVNVSTYPVLYGVVGNSYASGSFIPGVEFYLPDLRNRNPVGLGTQSNFDVLGETGGVISHTLTTSEMPAHTHTENNPDTGTPAYGVVQSGSGASLRRVNQYTGSTGGGQPHQILDPYLVLNFIIYTGVYLTPTPTPTITPTPTATATPNPGGQQTGPITGTITGSLVITQALPSNAFTTTLSTGNEFVFIRGASYGEIIAGAGGVVVVLVVVFYFVSQHAKRSE